MDNACDRRSKTHKEFASSEYHPGAPSRIAMYGNWALAGALTVGLPAAAVHYQQNANSSPKAPEGAAGDAIAMAKITEATEQRLSSETPEIRVACKAWRDQLQQEVFDYVTEQQAFAANTSEVFTVRERDRMIHDAVAMELSARTHGYHSRLSAHVRPRRVQHRTQYR